MKEQDRNPKEQLSEVETGNLPEKEFTVIILRMIQNLRKRMEAWIKKIQEMFNKDLEELKQTQTEVNNTITEMKNTPEVINSRIPEAKESKCSRGSSGFPPRGMGLDYIMSLPLLPISLWFLLFLFSCKRSFLVGSSLFH